MKMGNCNSLLSFEKEMNAQIIDMLEAVPLMYGVIEGSSWLYKTNGMPRFLNLFCMKFS